MGRHRKKATESHDVKNEENVNRGATTDVVDERLGLNGQVCGDCNARADEDADQCRKCGSTNLRDKAGRFRDT